MIKCPCCQKELKDINSHISYCSGENFEHEVTNYNFDNAYYIILGRYQISIIEDKNSYLIKVFEHIHEKPIGTFYLDEIPIITLEYIENLLILM